MEQKIFSKFNIYDQIGYLMVGFGGIFILLFDLVFFYSYLIPTLNSISLIFLIVIAYFIGHFTQSLANLISDLPIVNFLIKEDKKSFTKQQKEILKKAEKYFGVKKQSENEIWRLCYTLALAKDITGHVEAFNSYYSLYRGWLVIFFLQSLFVTIYTLFISSNFENSLLIIFFAFITLLFYRRSRRFWRYLGNKVLETFVVVKTLNL